jgi:prophage DNA circulation protein
MAILQPSFRGIPFWWDDRGFETTPRFAEHDFPQKAGRWHESMAPGPRIFTFSAWVIAPTRDLARALGVELAQACWDQRPGTLLHPAFGALRVVNKGCKLKESTDKLNRVDFDLTFVEDDRPTSPLATRWIGAALADAVLAALQAIASAIDSLWSLLELPAYAIDAAMAALGDVALALTEAVALLTLPVQEAIAVAGAVLGGAEILTGLGVTLCSAFTPFTVDANGNLLELTADQCTATWNALVTLATWSPPSETTNTNSKAVVAQAMQGLGAAVRRSALVQLANLTRVMTFPSANQAILARDELADMLQVEIIAAADDASLNFNPTAAEASRALKAVRAEMITDLTTRAASLQPVGHMTLPASRSALAVAYGLYGDNEGSAADRSNTLDLVADFIARNALQDPGQAPGGVRLEFLADTSRGA